MNMGTVRKTITQSRWFLLMCTVLFGFSVSASGKVSQEDIDHYYANMQKAVNMEADQLKQIQTINKDYGEKFKVLSGEEVSRWKKIRKARSLSKDQKKSIQRVLTEDQYSLYLEFVEREGKKLRQSIKDKRSAEKAAATEA